MQFLNHHHVHPLLGTGSKFLCHLRSRASLIQIRLATLAMSSSYLAAILDARHSSVRAILLSPHFTCHLVSAAGALPSLILALRRDSQRPRPSLDFGPRHWEHALVLGAWHDAWRFV